MWCPHIYNKTRWNPCLFLVAHRDLTTIKKRTKFIVAIVELPMVQMTWEQQGYGGAIRDNKIKARRANPFICGTITLHCVGDNRIVLLVTLAAIPQRVGGEGSRDERRVEKRGLRGWWRKVAAPCPLQISCNTGPTPAARPPAAHCLHALHTWQPAASQPALRSASFSAYSHRFGRILDPITFSLTIAQSLN